MEIFGIVFQTRGDLEEAEKMYKKSLEIDKKLGRLEEIASDFRNLGTVFKPEEIWTAQKKCIKSLWRLMKS